ncbi:hypothetical protein HanRHA438_Chr13g0579741 [Helianthus annuus]|nr:hypothetical protein HanRHA438_Chr13g0579741 [Helianthus annuus]
MLLCISLLLSLSLTALTRCYRSGIVVVLEACSGGDGDNDSVNDDVEIQRFQPGGKSGENGRKAGGY